MRIPQTREQKIKAILHGAQAVFIFVAGCLTLAVMTKPGGLSGETGYMFALVRSVSLTSVQREQFGLTSMCDSVSFRYQR